MPVRHPAVAGAFYPATSEEIVRTLDRLMPGQAARERVKGILVPHAGYMYSGPVAGAVYSRILVPDDVLILSPNHTGLGRPASLSPEGEWITPLGPVPVSDDLARRLKACHPLIEEDTESQVREHAAEVHLPFLQRINPNVRIAVLTLALYGRGSGPYGQEVLKVVTDLGAAVAGVIQELGRDVLIIASSDMNHYESDDETRKKDAKAVEAMKAMDEAGLFTVLDRKRISMCGYLPAAAAMAACKKLGATQGTLVQYQTSADAGGDRDRVVGYAGMMFQ